MISKKPLGRCRVPHWAIKDGQPITVPHLTYIPNECIKKNNLSDWVKKAELSPTYKKFAPMDATIYNTISTLN